jgi:ABC-2 type transport system permease protein
MMRLLGVEVRRALSRRLLWVLVGLSVLGSLIAGVVLLFRADAGFRLSTFGDIVGGVTVPVVLAMWTFGSSFIGAEWRAGTVATTLTWEPRRTRVLVAKGVAVALVTILVTIVLQAVLVGAMLPALFAKGTADPAEGARLGHLLGITFRGATLAGIAALLGFAIAAIARNTAFALGAGFVYLVIVENMLAGFFEGIRKWLVVGNAFVFVSGERQFDIGDRSAVGAGVVLAIYAALAVAIATALFRARDVT